MCTYDFLVVVPARVPWRFQVFRTLKKRECGRVRKTSALETVANPILRMGFRGECGNSLTLSKVRVRRPPNEVWELHCDRARLLQPYSGRGQ
jgi:hypothetical protein